MNSPCRLPYCISYRKSWRLNQQNAAGLMDENRRRDSRPFQRHLDVCARRPGDYMSRLQGSSELTSLQTEFAASKCEDLKPGG